MPDLVRKRKRCDETLRALEAQHKECASVEQALKAVCTHENSIFWDPPSCQYDKGYYTCHTCETSRTKMFGSMRTKAS